MSEKMIIGTPEFHAERKTGIGASEVGAVLGVNPYASPVDVWMEKVGRREPFEGNALTEFGQLMEDHIAKKYSEVTGRKVRKCNYTLRCGIIICHVDRLVHEDGVMPAVKDDIRTDRLLECKTGRDEWDDGVPAHYEAQAFAQMACCPSVQTVDFGAFFRSTAQYNMDFSVARDDAVIAEICDRLEEWWKEFVVAEVPPPARSEQDCKVLWGRHKEEKRVVAEDAVQAAVMRLNVLKQTAKEMKAEEDDLRRLIFSHMQDAEVLFSVDGQQKLATWKNNKDSVKTDWASVSEVFSRVAPAAYQDAIKKFTKTVEGARVLRLSKVK